MRTLKAAMVLVASLITYGGSYMALLQPLENEISALGLTSSERHASYRVGGDTASSFYAPMHWLDRHVRHEYWDHSVRFHPNEHEHREHIDMSIRHR